MKPQTETIIADLKSTFGELAGQDMRGADEGIDFLDQGFDSLFLTQAAAALKNRFGVKVTVRQLNENLTSFAALAAYLAEHLPAAATPPAQSKTNAPAPAIPQSPTTVTEIPMTFSIARMGEGSLTGTVLERVVKEQLRVMEMQLALLRGSTPGKGAPAILVPALESSAAPVTAPEPPVPAPATSQHGPFRQIDKGQRGGLTAQQQAHLNWLLPRYTARTPKSKEYTRRHRKHFADPRAVAGFKQNWKEMVYPIVSTRSSGANLWDLDGNRWVDVTMGFGVALLGHSPKFITEAVKQQLDLGVEIGPQSPLAGEVAELICEFTGMERVTFCNTGSEAVMAALRICRTVTARTKVALFSGAYHGTFDEVLVKGVWAGNDPKTLPIAPGVAPNLVSEVVVLEYGTTKSLDWIRQHSSDLAAVLVETVQSRHPDLQPVEFLREVRQITRATETPLIFDEVITGFRCHPGGAQALFGIEADLATYGKIIGGGMPFGFLAGKAWLMDAFDGGSWQFGDDSVPPAGVTFFAGTFVRHPLAMAAAKAMLLYLKEQGPQLQAGLAQRTDRLIGDLNRYFVQHGVPMHLEHFTSVWYPHFGAEVKHGSLLYYHLREQGLHIWEGRPCFLSTAHTAEDEAFIERAFKLSVAEMQDGGFLGGTSAGEFAEEVKRQKNAAVATPVTTDLPAPDSEDTVCRPPVAVNGGGGHDLVRDGGPLPPPPVAATGQAPDRFPLTEGQVEMWLAAQVVPEAAGPHHACNVIHLEGEFDVAALQRALADVILRHEALRCVFSPDGTEIVVKPSLKYELPVHDLSRLPRHERDARKQEIINQEGRRIFDLEQGPLFSFQLIKCSPREHFLVFTVQMIVCDGWGYNLVLEDLSAIYSAYVVRRQLALGPATPMRDYIRWQAEQERQAAEAEAREKFWLSQFKTLPPALDLPTFQPRPPARSFAGDRESLRLSPECYDAIKRVAKELKNTPFALLLAAYQTWLYRLSGQDDLVVGVPFAGQGSAGLETLVGQCVHTLPLRVKLDAGEPFVSLLRKARTVLLDAQENWNYGFGRLAQKLDLPRDASRIPLVSVIFNLDLPMSKVQFAGCSRDITAAPRFYYQYDLGFNLVDEGSTLLIECDYSRSLFDAETIRHWLSDFQTLLEGILADPTRPLGRLPLLSPADLKNCRSATNRAGHEPVGDATVHGLVSEQAGRTPEAVAVESGGQSLTYAELDCRSNQLGNLLRSLGVGPDRLVGVCMERSPNMIVAMLGILKAGGAYVPVDPNLPRERMAAILDDTGAAVLLTQSVLLPRLPETTIRFVCLDEDQDAISKESRALNSTGTGPDHLAYVIYTSGSTGRPKGVEISHRAVVNFLRSMQRQPGIKASDAVLAITTLSFDIAVLEIFLPLTVGARTVIATHETLMDPRRLDETIRGHGITVMQATPVTWRTLMNSGWRGDRALKALCGGEALARDLADWLLGSFGEIWNLYGPTETTVWSTVCRVSSGELITLGQPIANTHLYILDDQFQPVPVGVPGELLIGGEGLARGYRNQSELTAEKFIVSPFSDDKGGRLYRTGDLTRYRLNGDIEFIGRRDFQVKLRGFRIELGEIETVLLSHPQVCAAVASVREDEPGHPRLAAYIVVEESDPKANGFSAPGLRSDLRQWMRSRLPEYMIPSVLVLMDALPRTPEGKTDRRALPAPSPECVVLAEECVAPRNALEETLSRIWAELLKLERVGIRDNFFDLGGQSLLAVSLFGRIERELGRRLPLVTLFRAPTIEQLAEAIIHGREISADWDSLVPIQPKGSKPPLFLVHGAGGNVLLYRCLADHLAPEYPLYGLQSRGLDGKRTHLTTIEEMAIEYLKELRAVQPTGPYFLGGYCLGGTVAYEMAQILRRTGEEVRLVAMLDTYNFSVALKTNFLGHLLQKLKFHFGNFIHLRPREMLRYITEKVRIARDGELASLIGSKPAAAEVSGVSRATSGVEASVQAVNDLAAERYVPKPYPGRLTLFKPHVNYKFYPDPNMGWSGLALDGLDIVGLQVNPHAMLVEPYVQLLAKELKSRVEAHHPAGDESPARVIADSPTKAVPIR